MKRVSIVAVMLLLAVCNLAPVSAEQPNASFSDLKFYNTDQGVAAARDTFAWPADRSVSAQCTVGLAGYTGEKQIQLYVDMRDPTTGEIVSSSTKNFTLAAGTHKLVVGPLYLETVQGSVDLIG